MPRWTFTYDFNGGEYWETIELWADHCRQKDDVTVLADNVVIIVSGPIIKPPNLADASKI